MCRTNPALRIFTTFFVHWLPRLQRFYNTDRPLAEEPTHKNSPLSVLKEGWNDSDGHQQQHQQKWLFHFENKTLSIERASLPLSSFRSSSHLEKEITHLAHCVTAILVCLLLLLHFRKIFLFILFSFAAAAAIELAFLHATYKLWHRHRHRRN